MLKTAVQTLSAVALAAILAGTAQAATAHNSQAGSWGPTTHNCGPTPYFPAGGCVSSAIADETRFPFDEPPAFYRPAHRLTAPDGFVHPPAY